MDDILEALAAGRVTVDQARSALAEQGLSAVDDIALLDTHRDARTGLPEVVLGEGKTPDQVHRIVTSLAFAREQILVSRIDAAACAAARLEEIPDVGVTYDAEARLAVVRRADSTPGPARGRVAIVTGGTADRPAAREAQITAETAGAATRLWVDRGVAAPQRLAPTLREVLAWEPNVVIVAAGREGTLPTIVSAHLPVPVIGLPVSAGYGHGGKGTAALATMLQSCSPLAVVNIDAGVTAGLIAARIAASIHAAAHPTKTSAETNPLTVRGAQRRQS